MRIAEHIDMGNTHIKLVLSLSRDEALGLIASLAMAANPLTPPSLRVAYRGYVDDDTHSSPPIIAMIGIDVIPGEDK